MISVLQRVRQTGLCSPVLLGEERNVGDAGFDGTLGRVLDLQIPNGASVRP